VGDAELGLDHCRGGVTDAAGRALRWDLRWSALSPPFAYFPAPLERIASGATYAIVAVPMARAEGFVELDGERIECRDIPLEQTHLFGGHHAHRWGWVHAIGFEDDPDGYLTLVWAVPHRLGGRLPPVSSMALRLRGRELRPRGRQALRGVLWSDVGTDLARFSATLDGVSVEGEIHVPVETLAGVVYHDPEGPEVYCANTEVADLSLRLRDRDGTPSTARCVAACGFERGTRTQLPPEVWRALS